MPRSIIGILVVIALSLAAFLAFNAFIYNAKQAPTTDAQLLVGTSWQWTTTLQPSGTPFVPNQPERFVLTFEADGRFGTSTDCNTMGGAYTVNESELTFGDMFSTKMYCEGSQESIYADYLGQVTAYQVTEEGSLLLSLTHDQGTMVFVRE